MIVPGKSVNNIKIDDSIVVHPEAKKVSELSLNQTLYKLSNGIKIRTNNTNKINWISIAENSLGSSFESIEIGKSFKEIIERYVILYDEDEGDFKIEGIDGLCFSFGTDRLESIINQNLKIKYITIYNVSMDVDSHFWFDIRVTKNNLHKHL